jgi:hypothetical protein
MVFPGRQIVSRPDSQPGVHPLQLLMVRCSFARDDNMDTLLTQTNFSVSTETRTLCDFPLLIGEMLRRADRRSRRRVIRQARFQKFRAFFGIG